MGQLSLFPGHAAKRASEARAELEARHRALAGVAAGLPPGLRLGTSSWSFPGWRGIVYAETEGTALLAREGLREYARHPLLRTVGIDRGFYAEIPEADLRSYASQLPEGFLCCTKAPAAVTSPVLSGSGGERNPDFLSAERLRREMLGPFARAFAAHAGPFVLQFPPLPPELRRDPARFVDLLDGFFEALPRGPAYAVELRDRELLCEGYARVLARHGAAHVYNYWSAMPRPGVQAERLPPAAAPFVVVRLLLRPGTGYAKRRERFDPFDRIVDPDPGMRSDVTALALEAHRLAIPAFILVNNKAEGSAPLTIEEIAREIAAARQQSA